MKKRLLSLFLLLTLLLTLAGCGNDAVTDKAGGSTATSAVTTTVTDAPASTTAAMAAQSTAGDVTEAPTTVTTSATTAAKPTAGSSTAASTTTAATKAPATTAATKAPATTAPTASAADKALVDRAFALGTGEKIEGVTLTGVVTSSQGYNEGYDNATFDLLVEGTSGTKTIYCYRVKPATSRTEVLEGERLSLTGTIQNYKGTIEFYPAEYTHLGGSAPTTATPTVRPTGGSAAIDEDGIYDSKEEVALYIHTYGKLPKNYYPKSEFDKKDKYQCCGGDRFYNKEGRLPSGETYYECDIDTYGITSRGAKRLVWTKSGIVYYTGDHYETFTQLYGERE